MGSSFPRRKGLVFCAGPALPRRPAVQVTIPHGPQTTFKQLAIWG